MLRKLRLRVIIISMISVAAVLTVIIGSVNVLNYRNIIREADAILSVLGDNGGTFPQGREQDALKEVFSGDISRELPYETRFFSVTMDRRGNTKDIDIGRIASVDAQTAEKYAAEIIGSGKEHGFMDNYRYLNCDTEEGKTVIFLDCSRTLLSFRNFFLFSVLVSAFGLAAVTVLIILFSGRIVRPLMRSYEKQKEFITNAGHELKTPLTIIRADSELLKMEYGENEWLADIRNQSDRLCGLTDDLIRLSRMEEEPRNFSGSTVCLSDLIEETADSFQAPARVQEKLFQYETAEGLTVFGDKKNLRELISILLDNALKYSGVRGKIRLNAVKKGKSILMTVWNTAENLPEGNLDCLFERFYRADQSRNSESGGYGIGLSMAGAIVASHGGKIAAYSADGASLRITVTLPAAGTAEKGNYFHRNAGTMHRHAGKSEVTGMMRQSDRRKAGGTGRFLRK